jgi:hypothetical protein
MTFCAGAAKPAPRWPQNLFSTDLSPHTSALAALQQWSRAELYLRLDTQPDVNMSTTGIYACATHAECVISTARRFDIVLKIYHRSPVRHRTIGYKWRVNTILT